MAPIDSIERQADYYDQRWAEHTYASGLKLRRCIAILRAASETGLAQPSLIELGCGTGWLTAILGQFGPATGVELSPRAVEEATRLYHHARFVQADLTTWQPPREKFDIVVSHEVIEHLDTPGEHLAMAGELLRPGGSLILTTPNARVMRAMTEEQRTRWSGQPIENWLTLPELRRLALSHGFTVRSLSTLITGFGHQGFLRILNSTKVTALVDRLHMLRLYDAVRERLGLGLHLILHAQKL
jgi:SAM-dependent methyltransferase